MAQKIIRTLKKLRDLEDVKGEQLPDRALLRYKSSEEKFEFENATIRFKGDILTADGEQHLTTLAAPESTLVPQVITYDEAAISGITWKRIDEVFPGLKQPCYIATVADLGDLNLVNTPALIAGLDLVDDVDAVLQDGDRILVKDQTDLIDNGIFIYESTLNSGNGGIYRANDLIEGTILEGGELVVVKIGDEHGNTLFTLDNNRQSIVGTDDLLWVPITSLGAGAQYLNDLLDVNADSPNLVGNRYLKFDPLTSMWNAILIDFVESVQGYTGDVLLSTNDIPETSQRKYYNITRLVTDLNTLDLDAFGDVEYDRTIYDGNVLMWDNTIGAWGPRSVLSNIRLGDLNDVLIDYNSLWYQGCQNTPIYRTEVVYNEATNSYDTNIINTGKIRYTSYFLSIDCGESDWRPRNFSHLLGRYFLEDLQNVNANNRTHGRALMWDEDLYEWRPGGFVELRSTDDLPEGEVNLYLTDPNLINSVTRVIRLGHLVDVDSSLITYTPINQPLSKVLGWKPAEGIWDGVEALTADATTANIPEHAYKPVDPPLDPSQTDQRLYFSVNRVQATLHQYGGLNWFGDVDYVYGLSHGKSLVYDSGVGKWVAANPVIATTTDDLLEGNTNLYYTSQRVRDWTDDNIRDVGINYFHNVSVNEPPTDPNHAIVWDSLQGKWVSGYPVALPIQQLGDLLVGIGSNTDYGVLSVGLRGKYLRVDPFAPYGINWQDPDPIYTTKIQLPDIPRFDFVRSKDKSGLTMYLGTDAGADDPPDYVNPGGLGFLALYENLSGSSLNFLLDRVYYNLNFNDLDVPDTDDPNANSTLLSQQGLLVDFTYPDAYRPEELVIQANVQGSCFFRISVSDDAINWTDLNNTIIDGEALGFRFELDSDMAVELREGENSEIIDQDISLNGRYFYKIRLPFYQAGIGSDNLSDGFWRYMRIVPEEGITGTAEMYNIEFYGIYNTGIKFHTLIDDDIDHYLISGVTNLEILLPGTPTDIDELGIDTSFQCWLISDSEHTTYIYSSQLGRIFNNIDSETVHTIDNALALPPRSMAKILYAGLDVVTVSEQPLTQQQIVRWHVVFTGGGGGGGDLGAEQYYLDRANHFGTQSADSITGLARVALSNSYSDLSGLPALSSVAITGSYTSLINRPFLGTSAQYDVGTNATNIVQLDGSGRLPAIDGSQLTNLSVTTNVQVTSPLVNKGDIFVSNGSNDTRLGVAPLDGYVLMSDSAAPTGLSWQLVSNSSTDATTLQGQPPSFYLNRANHNGSIPAGAVIGLAPVALSNNYAELNNKPILGTAASYNVGTGANQVLLLSFANVLPPLDGSNLYNISSPLQNDGDIYVRAGGVDAPLSIGVNGQVLTADSTTPTGMAWKNLVVSDASLLAGNNSAYYLNRNNHTGTQPANTITGLATVATTGAYSDLSGAPNPNFHPVAYSGDYNNLGSKPVLGSASQLNVGLNPFNIVQLDAQGLLPASLRVAANSPLTTKGDIAVRGIAVDERFPIGAQGQVLSVDLNEDLGVKWIDPPTGNGGNEFVLPFNLTGDLLVYDGTEAVVLRKGPQDSILTVTNDTASGLNWVNPTFGGDMYRADYDSNLDGIVDLASAVEGIFGSSVSTYYGKDANNNIGFHPLPVTSPLNSKGDIYVHNGSNNIRFPLTTTNQVLMSDTSSPSGLKWSATVPTANNAQNLGGNNPSHYLSRDNHIGTQNVSTIDGLGTVAVYDVGTSPLNIVQLELDGKLPALDASQLFNLPGGNLTNKGDIPTFDGTNPAVLALGITGQVLSVDPNEPSGLKWIDVATGGGGGAVGDASTLNGQPPSYYLNLANHSGNITAAQVTGLGTAALLDVGLNPLEIVQIDATGKLPPLDGSQLTNVGAGLPITTKGDIIVHDGIASVRLPVGTERYVLSADPFSATGLAWTNEVDFAGNSNFLGGNDGAHYLDRANHTGQMPISGIQNNQVIVLLDGSGRLPPVDASLLTNVPLNTPLVSKGDLLVYDGTAYQRITLGTTGQVLTADTNDALGVVWADSAGGGGGGIVDAAYLNGEDGSYYLNRANHSGINNADLMANEQPSYYLDRVNHTGTQDASTITGLGTAALLNVGSNAFNIVQLDINGKLPLLDGSNLINVNANYPFTIKGELLTYDGANASLLTPGATGQLLQRDDAETTGLKWVDISAVQLDDLTPQFHADDFPVSLKTFNIVDTGAKAITATLPGNAQDGDRVAFTDYQQNFGNNSLTLLPGAGHTIYGEATVTMSVPGSALELIFWGGIWVKKGTELGVPATGNITALDTNGDGVADSADQIEGIALAADSTYYGKNQNGTVGFWAIPEYSPLTTKGDLYTHDGNKGFKLPIGTNGQLLSADPSTPTGMRWVDSISNSGDADNLNGNPGTYYLDRTNHTGTQGIATITGLGTVATLDVGILAFNVVQLDGSGRLPAVDASQLTNIPPTDLLTTKGDLLGHSGASPIRIPVGANGYVLVADEFSPGGFNWSNNVLNATSADTLDNNSPAYYLNRTNHTGTQSVNTIVGLGTAALLNVGIGANNIVQLTPDAKLPALDGSNLTNVPLGLPLIALGDILTHDGSNFVRQPPGSVGHVLTRDDTSPTGLSWQSVDALAGAELTPIFLDQALNTPPANSICIVDSTNNSIFITLPGNPPNGSKMFIMDYAGTFATNNVTISCSGGNTYRGQTSFSLIHDHDTLQLIFWNDRWIAFGTETPVTSVQGVYDLNSNGIVDNAEKIEGVDGAANTAIYGKDDQGNVGFYTITTIDGGTF